MERTFCLLWAIWQSSGSAAKAHTSWPFRPCPKAQRVFVAEGLAGREGFEPPERFHVRRFSRPEQSTALPPTRHWRSRWRMLDTGSSSSANPPATNILLAVGQGRKAQLVRAFAAQPDDCRIGHDMQMLSPGLMFSKAGDLGSLVHSFIVVCCQLLKSSTGFELNVLNSARERTPHRIFRVRTRYQVPVRC